MTDTPTPTPAGWYPAPDGTPATWWWDGAQWVQPVQMTSQQPAATGAIAKLATATQVLLIVCGGLAAIIIGIELFGVAATTSFLDGQTSSTEMLDIYDLASAPVGLVSAAALIAAGVLWVIWQHRVARQVAGLTRRAPGWHSGSWFVPVINLWFPYQNISDLWKAVGRAQPSWLIIWWLLWLASNTVIQLSARVYLAAEDLEQYRSAMWLSIAGEALTLAAAVLAVLVVRGITQGLLQRSSVPEPVPSELPS